MIPSTPMQLTLFGSALYGDLYVGLCRALAAPWLDPGWLVRVSQQPRAPGPAVAAIRQDHAQAHSTAARPSESGGGQVIEVPAARWQGHRARSATSIADR
jgi:hypothetical protein